MRLLVISHTPHYKDTGGFSGWGSTVRELDQLAELFDELVHLAPLYPGPAPESSLSYSNIKIKFVPIKPAGGEKFRDKLSILGRIPAWLTAMRSEIKKADAIHIRCPAGISLVALLAQRVWGLGKPTWVKYAGNWQPGQKVSWSYDVQRFWLRKNLHHGVVTVNGSWSGQPEHIVTFNNPSFSQEEWLKAKQAAREKHLTVPLQLLFVGRVEPAKGIGSVLQIAEILLQRDIDFYLNIIGDGPDKLAFERSAEQKGLAGRVTFLGWKSRKEIDDYYTDAHFILLPSCASEGWPKVLSEAMSYGVVPLAAAISSIPAGLSKAGSGLAIPAENSEAYVEAILDYTEEPDRWRKESQNGVNAAEGFTYEQYLNAAIKLYSTNKKINRGV